MTTLNRHLVAAAFTALASAVLLVGAVGPAAPAGAVAQQARLVA